MPALLFSPLLSDSRQDFADVTVEMNDSQCHSTGWRHVRHLVDITKLRE
jgi:hypothetical protein